VRTVLYILLALLVLLQLRLWVSDDGYRAAWRLSRAGDVAQEQENEALRERNRALAAEVSDLKTGLDAVEEIARSELGMIRPARRSTRWSTWKRTSPTRRRSER
jgi:cell division protein FtsB